MTGKKRICKDCKSTTRPAPKPGPRCVTCHRRRRKTLQEARRLAYVARQYNLTPEQYRALVETCPVNDRGDRVCPGCLRNKPRQVEHDHSCCPGKISCGRCVRMLCCGPCNKTFAHFRDDPNAFERMAQLLRNPPWWSAPLRGA